jgi:hypothetical protein
MCPGSPGARFPADAGIEGRYGGSKGVGGGAPFYWRSKFADILYVFQFFLNWTSSCFVLRAAIPYRSMNPLPAFTLLFLLAFSPLAQSASYLLGTTFSSDNPTVNPNYGTGTLSYEAEQPLVDGSYAWDSISNLQLVIALGSSVFTEDDLLTLSSTVYIEVRNGGFFFSNIDGYSTTSPGGGSADFTSGSYNLSVQPSPVGSSSPVRFVHSNPGDSFFVGGTYAPTAAVPEPSVAMLSVLAVAGFAARRRRSR